jgi:hypothetical protein
MVAVKQAEAPLGVKRHTFATSLEKAPKIMRCLFFHKSNKTLFADL